MSPPRPGVLAIDDRIRFAGAAQSVAGLSGTVIRLADENGGTSVVQLARLLADATFGRTGEGRAAPLLPAALLNAVPEEAVEQAMWWQRHLAEVLTGLAPEAAASTTPRPQYDPAARTLAEREQAQGGGADRADRKHGQRAHGQAETAAISGTGHRRGSGLAGRAGASGRGRTDPRAVDALRQAVREAAGGSTRTVGYFAEAVRCSAG